MQQARMRKNNLLAVSIAAIIGLGASGSAYAVNGFQVISYGEDHVALGGAVTANPISAMTALSNPAGLTVVGERADFSMQAFMPDVKVDATNTPFTGGGMLGAGEVKKSEGDFYGVPSIGWVAKTGNPNVSFGGGMYATAGLGAEFGSIRLNGTSDPLTGAPPTTLNGFSNVGIFRISPAVGYKIAPNFSIGAALDVYMLQLSFRETLSNTPGNPLAGIPAGASDMNFNLGRAGQSFGAGATVGLMFDAVPNLLRLGAAYTTKANLQDTEFELGAGDINNPGLIQQTEGSFGPAPAGTYKAGFDFPQQAAVGLALMPNGPFTLSADVKWINYKDTLEHFYVSGQGRTYDLNPGWDDVWVYAVGASFKTGPVRLMADYNYSDAPVKENFAFSNVIFPAIVKQHITLGANYQLGKNWEVGGTLQYVPEERITGRGDLANLPAAQPGAFGPDSNITLSNQITTVGVNLGYRF